VPAIDLKRLKAHRSRTFATSPARRVSSPAQALDFVNTRGFVYFWPIKGVDLPSLWTAVAGDRPVADEHDDQGHVTWSWKDDALDKKVWYYAKILRRKATLISLEIVPYFYALSENYGSPEEDYLLAYEEGRLTQAAKQVYEALLKEGALNTIDLRRAFIYEVVPRYYPDLPKKARRIGEASGCKKLAELYFHSVGAAQFRDLVKLFGWGSELTARTVSQLMDSEVIKETTFPKRQGEWLALSELCS
jgi:hypothetical protein